MGLSPLYPPLQCWRSGTPVRKLVVKSATQHWRGGSGVCGPCTTILISFYRWRLVIQYIREQVLPTLRLASRFVPEASVRARSLVPGAPALREQFYVVAKRSSGSFNWFETDSCESVCHRLPMYSLWSSLFCTNKDPSTFLVIFWWV